MRLNWIKPKPKRTPTDELREQVAQLKQELAEENLCRSAHFATINRRLAALEKNMVDVKDCTVALTKLTSTDEIEQNCGHLHMLKRTLFKDDG